jgi:hypothetical protein
MTLVRQRGPADCGIAAIAMLTGRPYEEVYAAARKANGGHAFNRKNGMTSSERVLEELGYHWENLGRHKDHPAPNPDGPQFRSLGLSWASWTLNPKFYAKFFWGRRAILSIHSLNNVPDGRHLVYFDGFRIWDPQEGRKGKKFATEIEKVVIEEALIFQEMGDAR